MTSLHDLVTDALTSTDTEAQLARAIVDSGALEQIMAKGTLDEEAVRKRLEYSSPDALRAAVSKARHKKGHLPLPVAEGRRWARSAVDQYRKARRRTQPTGRAASIESTSDSDASSSSSSNASITTIDRDNAITRTNSSTVSDATTSSGTLESGTGATDDGSGSGMARINWR